MYVPPGFCPPNLLLAKAIASGIGFVSSQVANEGWELGLLIGSLIDGRRRIMIVQTTAWRIEIQSEFLSACVL